MNNPKMLSDEELENVKDSLLRILTDETLSKNEAKQYQERLGQVYVELKRRKGKK